MDGRGLAYSILQERASGDAVSIRDGCTDGVGCRRPMRPISGMSAHPKVARTDAYTPEPENAPGRLRGAMPFEDPPWTSGPAATTDDRHDAGLHTAHDPYHSRMDPADVDLNADETTIFDSVPADGPAVVWAATSPTTGRFFPGERRSDAMDPSERFNGLRSHGQGHLEVRLPDGEFPQLTSGFRMIMPLSI